MNPFKQKNNDRKTTYKNNNYINNFSKKNINTNDDIIPKTIFSLENEMFPDLQKNDFKKQDLEPIEAKNVDFKTALATEIVVKEKSYIKSGWVEISQGLNGKIQYNYGENTNQIKSIFEEDNEYYNKNINKIMSNAIDNMKQNWDNYRKKYDELYGEGTYDEIYHLTPIYGSEYSNSDNDTEEETDLDDDDNYY